MRTSIPRVAAIALAAVLASLAVPELLVAADDLLPGDTPVAPSWQSQLGTPRGTSETFLDMHADGSYYDPSIGRRVAPASRAAAERYGEPSAALTRIAHVYSLGVGTVHCATPRNWNIDFASAMGWAYTNLRDEHAVLGPTACEGALNVGSTTVPLWQQALGTLALTHEAFHLRHWRFQRNEGKVSCQALVHFRGAAQQLGATAEHAEQLYPYALALHAHQTQLFSHYRDPSCVIPPWAPPGT